MGFRNYAELQQAVDDGKTWFSTWRRTAPAMLTSNFVDMSYGGGGPAANYYASAPLVWTSLAATDGIGHGPSVSPGTKHLKSMWISGSSATGYVTLMLLDYIKYVPFLDGDSDQEQTFTSSSTSPPRTTTGAGDKVMLIGQGSGTTFSKVALRYTNQYGVERVTPYEWNNANFAAAAGSSLLGLNATTLTGDAPFMHVYPGDNVVSIQGVQLRTASGGIFAVVVVRPVVWIHNLEALTPFEVDYFAEKLTGPVVQDGAYLNFIGLASTAATPALVAGLDFIWS